MAQGQVGGVGEPMEWCKGGAGHGQGCGVGKARCWGKAAPAGWNLRRVLSLV